MATIYDFTLTDGKGNVVARFEPTADMDDVRACVEKLL
jgi:glutathione peroxidase